MNKTAADDNFVENKELIIKIIRTLFPDVKMYLFGSRARKTNTVRSDIDLAIDAGEKISDAELYRARDVLSALRIPQSIDLVDLQAINDTLKNEILSEGVVWE